MSHFSVGFAWCIMLSVLAGAIPTEQVPELRKTLAELGGNESIVRLARALDPELKGRVIEALRAETQEADAFGAPSEHLYKYLFYFGDEATMEKYASAYATGDESVGTSFSFCQNPRAIELIAPVMFREEGWVAKGVESRAVILHRRFDPADAGNDAGL